MPKSITEDSHAQNCLTAPQNVVAAVTELCVIDAPAQVSWNDVLSADKSADKPESGYSDD